MVTRVLNAKKDQLMKDLTQGSIFRVAEAHLWVVEFQKRGLPHVHILLILAEPDRPMTPEQVDSMVTAELPPSPLEESIYENEKGKRQPLCDIVLSNMIHGPCGVHNPHSPCIENGKCTKRFPKRFKDRTIVDADSTHPVYRC